MKLLLIITTLYYLSIQPTFSGCSSSADRRLGIRTTDVPGAATVRVKYMRISILMEHGNHSGEQ